MRLRRGQDRRRLLLLNQGAENPILEVLPSDTTGLQLVLDYRAGMLQSVGGAAADTAGHLVGEWVDQHTTGNNFSQTSSTNKPPLVDDGGVLVPEFDGVSDFLEVVSLLSAGGSSARTLFILAKAVTAPGVAEAIFALNHPQDGAGNGRLYSVCGEVALRVANYFEVYNTALSQANYQVLAMRNPANANVTDAQAWLDSSELSAASSTAGLINVLGSATSIGKVATLYGNYRIKAVWFYNVEKDNTQRAALEAEMALIP